MILNEGKNVTPGMNRIELFARNNADGWHSWGNEVESDIIFACHKSANKIVQL